MGDTTSILLGSFAGMNFFDFFWMKGRPGIFFGVELGALASLGVLLTLYGLRSGLVCAGLCLFGVLRACLRRVSVPVAGVGPCGVRSFSRRLHFQTAV